MRIFGKIKGSNGIRVAGVSAAIIGLTFSCLTGQQVFGVETKDKDLGKEHEGNSRSVIADHNVIAPKGANGTLTGKNSTVSAMLEDHRESINSQPRTKRDLTDEKSVVKPGDFQDEDYIITPNAPYEWLDTIYLQETDNVKYTINNKDIEFNSKRMFEIKPKYGEKIVIVATPINGHEFKNDQPTKWEFVGKDYTTTPLEPTREGNTITIEETRGTTYYANNKEIEFDNKNKKTIKLTYGEELVISATPYEPYTFTGEQFREWKFVGEKDLTKPNKITRKQNTITVTDTNGVYYMIDGKKIEFNNEGKAKLTLEPNKELVIKVIPDEKHKFASGKPEYFRFTGRVNPNEPIREGKTVIITEQEGVTYLVNDGEEEFEDGKLVMGIDESIPGNAIKISAKPSKSKRFENDSITEAWYYVIRNNQMLLIYSDHYFEKFAYGGPKFEPVTPATPTRKGNKVTIKETPGVTYVADGEEIVFNTGGEATLTLILGKETTITATADQYYKINEGVENEWKFTGEKETITPEKPGREANKVTVTATNGSNYTVDGKKVDFEGKNEVTFTIGDGKELVVAATPDEAHVFDGDQSREWKFAWVAPAETKQSDIPKPKPVDTKQSDKPKPVDTKQSDKPKPVDTKQSDKPKPVDTKQSDKPKPAPIGPEPIKRSNPQPKTPTPATKTIDKKQSDANNKQSGNTKKKTLPNTGANAATITIISLIAALSAAGCVTLRRKI